MTSDGVDEATPEEGRRLFREACRRELGVEPEEFLEWYHSGTGDPPKGWNHEAIVAVGILIPFWGSDS